ncbi:methyl-accepting chemotaxis protein [Massilia sp. PAMC28688]|uniref:MCP four helix bundle domain-containing protein n=1 Tax=Massilia sp. PAMC28688 TaxID=2861283 RepID=UPI001C6264F2|nr:methyl-accepting chemotaxis protein [Massilia sp. PAMC28688]QYF92875.1 methyl-accepting chemotaxis protein [Massilia sp. PAMC28688]
MLDRLRIGTKLLLAPALVLLLLIASSGSAWWAMVRQHAMLETVVEVRAARIREVAHLASSVQAAHAKSYQLLTWISASMSAPRTSALVGDIHARHAAIVHAFEQLQAERPAPERALVAQGRAAYGRYIQAVHDVIEMSRGDQSLAASAMVKAERTFDDVAAHLAKLAQREQALAEAAARRAAADVASMSVLMPVLVALSVFLALGISMAVRRSLLAEVRAIAQSALDLASGKLTVRARAYGNDEIADTARVLDESIRNLNGTLKGVIDSASALGLASEASGAMVERLARFMAAAPDDASRLLDWPDACAVVETRQKTSSNCVLVEEAAAVAAALQQQVMSLSQAVAGIELDGGDEPRPVPGARAHLRLASRRD